MRHRKYIIGILATLILLIGYIFWYNPSKETTSTTYTTKNSSLFSEAVLQALKKENYPIASLVLNSPSNQIILVVDNINGRGKEIDEIKKIIMQTTQNTLYKDYVIDVHPKGSIQVGLQLPSNLNDIFQTLQINLRAEFNNIEDINIAERSEGIVVDVKAKISLSDSNANSLGKEIEQKVIQTVQSKRNIKKSSLEINVYNQDKNKIN